MHYGPSPIDESDQTEINVFFFEEPIEREVQTTYMGPQHLDDSSSCQQTKSGPSTAPWTWPQT